MTRWNCSLTAVTSHATAVQVSTVAQIYRMDASPMYAYCIFSLFYNTYILCKNVEVTKPLFKTTKQDARKSSVALTIILLSRLDHTLLNPSSKCKFMPAADMV